MDSGTGTTVPHILILEDDTAIQDLVLRAFRKDPDQLRVSVAGTIHDARDIVGLDPPDLIIADWMLPDGKGIEILPRRDGVVTVPLVIMTSHGDEALAVEIMKSGAIDYVVKSAIVFRDLPHIARRALRDWENIRQRKQAEEAVRESEECYRGVFENTGTATVIVEEDTTICLANDEFCRLSGCRKEEIEGRRQWTEFVVPEDLDRMLTQHRLRRKQLQEALRHYEFRFITKANQIRDIYLTIDVIRGTKRSVASLLDITERKAAEKLLRESEKKFHDTVLNLDEAFYSCTPEGVLLEHNPAFNRILGFDPGQDLRGTHLLDLWQREHDRQKYLNELVNTGFVRNFFIDAKRHGGEKIVVMANSHLVRDEKNMPVRIEGTFLDITDRKRAEDALIRSESFLNQTQQITKVGGWEYDVATGKIEWTSEVYRIYEVPADYDTNNIQQAVEFYAPEDRAIIENAFLRAVEQGEPYDLELRFIGAKGTHKWVRTTAQVERISGKTTRVFGNIIDITDRKEAVEEVFHMAQEWQRTFDATNDAIWILNKDQRVLRSNKTAERFFQRSCGELIGKHCWEIVHCTEQPIPECPFLRVKNSLHRETMELQIDGGWFDVTVDPILDAAGEFAGAVHIISDITKRKRAEEALWFVQEKYTKAFLAAPDAITMSELDSGRFVEINEAATALFGYSREELIGKSALELGIWQKKEDRAAFIDQIREHGRVIQYEVMERRKSGELFNALVNADTLSIGGLNYLITIFRDITEQKQAEEAVRDSQKRLVDILSFLPDAVLAIDNEGMVIAWNKAIEEMTGVAAADMLGKDDHEYSIPFYGERRPILIDLILMEDTETEKKYLFVHRDGEKLISEVFIPAMYGGRGAHLWFTASPLYDTAGKRVGAIETIRDITERKQVEKALQESEERYRSVVEDQTEFICRFTPDGRITFVNDAYCRYFSLDKSQCIAKPHSVMLLPEDARLMKRHIASLTQENPVAIVEHRIVMPSGEIRWQRWSDRAIFDKDRRLVEYQSVGRDTTEKKQAEQALQESEERYRSVVEDQTEFICRFTPDGRITFVNDAYCRYFSLDKSQCIAKSHRVMLFPEDALLMKRHLASLTIENPVAIIEHRIVMPSGEIRWQRWSDRAIFDKDRRLVEYQSVGRDTTEKKQAEEALRDSEIRYRSVIENAAEGIVVAQDGILQYANTRALEMIDSSPEEIGNQQFTDFIHPDNRALVYDRYQRRIRGENVPQNYDFRIVGKSGQITWVQVSAVQFSWNNRPATLNFLTDITDHKFMESEIRSLNTVLEERIKDRTEALSKANEALEEENAQRQEAEKKLRASYDEKVMLLKEIHHRVKNNLQIIVSLLNLQSRNIKDESTRAAIRDSQNRVKAMALVHEKLYRAEDISHINLHDYIRFLGSGLFQYYDAKSRGIQFTLEIHDVYVDIDAAIPLGLILNELISNSLKYAFPEGRKGEIAISVKREDRTMTVLFRDNGIGIPADLDWRDTQSLGLRLVNTLVNQMNGTVELDRSAGTLFTMVVHEKEQQGQ